MLQAFNGQFHKPGNQQGKTVGGKKKTAAGSITPAERNKVRLQECKLFNSDFPPFRMTSELKNTDADCTLGI
jgi:hypothetical protein